MYTPEKKNKGKPPPKVKGKKGKKKPVVIPNLMKFPPIPEDPAKIRKIRRAKKKQKDSPDAIVTTMNLGYPEKTTRPRLPLTEGGSIRDVICKKTFPMLPRPQPHGGVYGNIKCVLCASNAGLLKTVFGLLHKKMRTLLNKQFDKAKAFIEWAIDRFREMSNNYLQHIKNIMEEMGPTLDTLDEQEWEDHQNVKNYKDNYRKMQKELARIRAELKRLRKKRNEVIEERLSEKVKEMLEAERQMMELENRVREAEEMLRDWTENKDSKLAGPRAEIERIKELLAKVCYVCLFMELHILISAYHSNFICI